MRLFRYKGRYLTGDKAKGVIVASSVDEAIRLLQNRGIFVKPGDVKEKKFSIYKYLPLFASDWHFLFSSLHKLVGKVPPQEAVQILIEDQINPKVALFLFKVREAMEEGLPLSQALERAGAPKDVVDMIANGERSGMLVNVLGSLAEVYQEKKGINKEALSAVAYPAVIFVILIVLLVFFIPPILSQFGQTLSSTVPGYKLPTLTVWVIKAGKMLPKVGTAVMVALPVLFYAGWGFYRQNLYFKKLIDRLVLSFPLVGQGYLALHLYKSFMTFYILYRTGFKISLALQSILDGTQNYYLKRAWQIVYDAHVRQSYSLARAFSYHPYIPTPVKNFISIGVESGELAERLKDALEYLKDRFYAYSAYIKGTITPVMFFVSFGIILVVFLSIALPIFGLMKQLQNLH